MQIYKITYVSQFPFAILSGVIVSASDCLILTLGFHLCARLSALSRRIEKTDFKFDYDGQKLKSIISIHQKILRSLFYIGNKQIIAVAVVSKGYQHLFIEQP